MINEKVTAAKAVVAAIGSTCTAVAVAAASVQVALDDGALDFGEYGLVATALATLIGTVYGVWKIENKPVNGDVRGLVD